MRLCVYVAILGVVRVYLAKETKEHYKLSQRKPNKTHVTARNVWSNTQDQSVTVKNKHENITNHYHLYQNVLASQYRHTQNPEKTMFITKRFCLLVLFAAC